MKFLCDCEYHLLEIHYDKPIKKFPFATLWFGMYETRSPKTGRKLKKPKLVGDAIFMDIGLKKLAKFMKKLVEEIMEEYGVGDEKT